MFIETVTVGVFQCNCTILACEETRQAVVVDPGDESERILEIVRSHGLEVVYAIHTHAHIDHIMATDDVVRETGAQARLHADDTSLWNATDAIAARFGIPPPRRPALGEPFADGERIRFGRVEAHVVHTPGHTPGSCCFTLETADAHAPILLSGDTLFRGKIGLSGRPNKKLLVESIRDRLFKLDDATRVIPGHGPETTIGAERRDNSFVR